MAKAGDDDQREERQVADAVRETEVELLILAPREAPEDAEDREDRQLHPARDLDPAPQRPGRGLAQDLLRLRLLDDAHPQIVGGWRQMHLCGAFGAPNAQVSRSRRSATRVCSSSTCAS